MLPKSSRLNLKTSFKWVVSGKRKENDSFKIYSKLGENKHPLIGVSMSKKLIKLAVDRNKVKRNVFLALEKVLPTLPSNINLVIMPKASVLNKKAEEMVKDLM